MPLQSLGLEKDLIVGMYTIRESLFSNHRSESWILPHVSICFPKILQFKKTTKHHFYINVLYLGHILLNCNMQKHLCWIHFYNLLTTFTFRFYIRNYNYLCLFSIIIISGGFRNFERYLEILPKSLRNCV